MGECPFRFIAGECPDCEGAGEVCVGTLNPFGGGPERLDPPEPIFEKCPTCDGTGEREVEVEPIEMEDLPA
jgi:hypothetical protein